VEVLAVDRSEELVRTAAAFAAEAVSFDATNEEQLARTSPARRDLCIVAIGNESREDSIICTALLRQMGAGRIVGRATDPLHARILHLVGAHEVVNPEQAFGERFAAHLLYAGVIDEIQLGKDLSITELRAPRSFVGRNLIDLELPRRYGVTVIAVRREATDEVIVPKPAEPIVDGDILVVVAKPDSITRMGERA
jgi:trk system potassium uptake protein TrkA